MESMGFTTRKNELIPTILQVLLLYLVKALFSTISFKNSFYYRRKFEDNE